MTAGAESALAGLARFTLGAALFWTALGAANLPRPSLSPEKAKVLWEKAQEARDAGRARESLRAVCRLLSAFPDNHLYLSFAASIFREVKEPAKEARALELFMSAAPLPTEACPRLGQAYREQGLLKEALAAHRRCLALDPTKSDLLFYLAHELERQDETQEAERLYREVLARSPDYSDASLGLARLKSARNELAAAKAIVDAVLAKSPRNTDALAAGAAIAEKRGDYAAASALLRTAIEVSPAYADLYRMLGRISLALGDRERAATAYAALRELEPGDAVAARKLKELRAAPKP